MSASRCLDMTAPAPICEGDCCSVAVKRAYSEMRNSGAAEAAAYDAALAVFGWYHPEVASQQAHGIVSQWIRTGQPH